LDCFGKLLAPKGAQERYIEKNSRRAHAIDPADDRPADEGEWPEYGCPRSSLEKLSVPFSLSAVSAMNSFLFIM
jgi:hypothetical protein